jgi:hypothetical protein
VGRRAAFSSAFLAVAHLSILRFYTIPFRSLSDHERFIGIYHHIYISERVQAHSHVSSNYSTCFLLLLGGDGVGRPSDFVCYISHLRYLVKFPVWC